MQDPDEALTVKTPGEFPMKNRRVVLCLVIASVTFIVSLLFLVLGLVVAFPEPATNKRVLTVLVGAGGVVFSLLMFASNWPKYGQRVAVSQEELRFYKGGRWSVAPWDDITAIWRRSATIEGSLVLAETALWLRLRDGRTIYLASFFRDMARLVEIVLTETSHRMVPAKWLQIQQGQTVEFGNLKISATELRCSKQALTWNNVQSIHVANGALDIRRKSDNASWYYTPIKNLPNYHIFLALAEMLMEAVGVPKRDSDG